MSFNRLKYDKCETQEYNKITTGPGDYYMQTPIMCNNCLNDNPWIQNQKTGVSMNSHVDWRFYSGPVDIESDLLNLNRPATKCGTEKYLPKCNEGSCSTGEPCGAGVIQGCQDPKNPLRHKWNRPGDNNLTNFPRCHFPVDDTRLNNPASNLRGTGWNRFDILFFNPQKDVFFPGELNTNTRMVMKDNHRAKIPNPGVNSMNPNPDAKLPQISTGRAPANFTGSMYQYDVCG